MSTRRPSAGVAMCVYNGVRFLQEQIDSICAQTELPLRMAVVDDNSSDGSWELLRRWAPCAPFEVRLQRNQTNLGVVRNFELATNLVGDDIDVVFLADQDDCWYRDKLALFVNQFEGDPGLLLLHSDADLIDGEGRTLGRRLFETLLVTDAERREVAAGMAWRAYAKRNLVTGAACALRRSLLAQALPFSPHWVHDEWLAFHAALLGRVSMIDHPTMAYRLHQSNTVGLPIPNWKWRVGTSLQALLKPTVKRQMQRADRLQEVLLQAQRLGASQQANEGLQEALAHARFRSHLARNPVSRASAVWREWRGGAYHRWSNGEISMLHDMLIAR